jgi:hypothetical protein
MAGWNMSAGAGNGLRPCVKPACNAKPNALLRFTLSAGREKLSSPAYCLKVE